MTLPLAAPRVVRRWVLRTLLENRTRFTAMMTLFITAIAAGLLGPWLLGDIIDVVVSSGDAGRVDLLALGFLAALLVETVLVRAARQRATVLGEHLLARCREDVVGRALRLPLSTVEDAGTGDLLSRTTTDVDRIDHAVRHAVPEITNSLLMLALTVAAMVLASPTLACGLLVAVPITVLSTRWYARSSGPTLQRLLGWEAAVRATTHETVDGARTVHSLRLGERRVRHHDDALETYLVQEKRHRFLLTAWLPCQEIAYLAPLPVILALGLLGHQQGWAGIGTITTVVLYAQAMSAPLDELLSWIDELQIGNAALRRILGVSELPAEDTGNPRIPADDTGDAQPSAAEPAADRTSTRAPDGRAHRDIDIASVRFAYRPDRPILHGLDLHIPEGSRVVVLGPSGAGKSTLARLLTGINAPDSGTIRIGGADITAFGTDALRREIMLLTQENHVFSRSVRDNLTLVGEHSDAALDAALGRVELLDWARELPDGLDTQLGSGGTAVSAAHAQQLALARVLLADPHTLVLDEATSLLDTATSRSLERSLAEALTGRTVLAIAHQPHLAVDADAIVVIEDGRIVEHGRHADLLAAGGSYAALHRAAQPS